MDTFSLEKKVEIWNDCDGTRIEVGPDRDALGLIEIRQHDENGKVQQQLVMPVPQARLLVDALVIVLRDHPDESV